MPSPFCWRLKVHAVHGQINIATLTKDSLFSAPHEGLILIRLAFLFYIRKKGKKIT